MGERVVGGALRERLKRESEVVLARWRDRILKSYPEETAQFLAREKDEFANPVGHAVRRDTQAMLELLTTGFDRQRALPALDGVVRIRAVQSMAPSEALRFLVQLKEVVREWVEKGPEPEQVRAELRTFESEVDELLLAGLDVFVACREQVQEVARAQLKSMVHVLIERANRAPARNTAAEAKGSM